MLTFGHPSVAKCEFRCADVACMWESVPEAKSQQLLDALCDNGVDRECKSPSSHFARYLLRQGCYNTSCWRLADEIFYSTRFVILIFTTPSIIWCIGGLYVYNSW
jgi:hypothetical protein